MSIVVFDPAKFRTLFPEFGDVTKYPDVMLQMYFDMASEFISPADCPCAMLAGSRREWSLYLLTAHLLTLALRAQAEAAAGQAPSAGGIETSASIGDISVGRMAPPATDGWQYWLAQTPYGQQIWALLEMVSVGGTFVGGLPERYGFRKIGGVF